LLLLPTGLLFVAAGLTNSPPIGDEAVSDSIWVFVGAVIVAAFGYFFINRYYVNTFGKINPSTAVKVRVAAYTVVAAVVICVGISIDSQLDLPISAYGFAYSVTLLAYYRLIVGLRPYHWILLGGLAVLCALPIWGGVDDKLSLALIGLGLVSMAVGVFDHRELLRSLDAVRSSAVAGEVGVDADIS
jgi:hypothetical protein